MLYTHAQAIYLFRAYGARVPVALGAQALSARARMVRAAQQRARSSAGLAELAVASDPYLVRGMFETNAQFHLRVLALRTQARAAQLASEMQ